MKKTTTDVTCDRCRLQLDIEHWEKSFNVRRDAVFWDANQILEGDYCVSCSILFETTMQDAYTKWRTSV